MTEISRAMRSALAVVTAAITGGLACAAPPDLRGAEAVAADGAATREADAPAEAGSWLARAREHVAQREYRASRSGSGLQAPNRQHGLRTWFAPDGIRVEARTAPGRALLGLRLAAIGRPQALHTPEPGDVHADGARVEIRRPTLVEWYENGPEGLEQGFTLLRRPEGAGDLWLELSLEGATASARGDGLVFTTAAGRRLGYGKLAAWDADGRSLEVALSAPAPHRIRLAVTDAAARYPVVVDPLLTAVADTLLQGDQSSANLGTSVAGAGDVNGDGFDDVIIGAGGYDAGQPGEGAAFVFLGSAAGIADAAPISAQAQLESNQAGAGFGDSVASAGDLNGDGHADVVVGAHSYDAGEADEGAAFVFHGGPTGIADGSPATADAQLEGNAPAVLFGSSVAGAGDVDGDGYADILVGAPLLDAPSAFDAGGAFLFHGSASGITGTGPADADGAILGDQAGVRVGDTVAGAGDVDGDGHADVLVTVPRQVEGPMDESVVLVFLGGVAGVGTQTPASAHARIESHLTLIAPEVDAASAGDVNGDGYADVIVGWPAYDVGGGAIGLAAIFHGSATGISDGDPATATTQLEATALSFFGRGVAGAGDVNADGYADVLVGAPSAGSSSNGRTYVFLGAAGGIATGNETDADAELAGTAGTLSFGASVATAGDVNGDGFADVLVGDSDFGAGESFEGAAFVYLGGSAGFTGTDPATASTRLESNQASSAFGFSVAGAGDVNGDGYADVIVGADDYDAGEADEGAAFVFLGSAAGVLDAIPVSAHAQLESDQANAAFGVSVAGAGDVDGDGYGDVLVGASGYDDTLVDEGAAFLFRGSASGVASGDPGSADATLTGGQAGALFGRSVASAGDVNGDGFVDALVGANGWDEPETLEGAAFLFLGSASGIADSTTAGASARFQSDDAGAQMGTSVASAGDVNGDGFGDVVIGAERYDGGLSQEGAAFVFHGSAAGISDGHPGTADARIEGEQLDAKLGASVSGAGDVDGDGYGDLIVGAPEYDAGETNEGAAFVFHGSPGGIVTGGPANADARLEGDQAGALFGRSVAGVGDVDGDGYADVAVGGHLYDEVATNEGIAAIFTGSATGVGDGSPATAHAAFFGADGAFLGQSVAGAGDVDGDGFADVIVGAERYAAGQVQEGGAFVLRGNQGGGRNALPEQRTILGDRIPPWGPALGTTFEVALRADHPEGHGLVALELEVCPAGTAFEDAACEVASSPAWTEVGGAAGADVLLALETSGLDEGALYRWRARVLRAPLSVGMPGIAAPPALAHGPWRRPVAQAVEADVRVLPEPSAWLGLACGLLSLRALARRRVRRLEERTAVGTPG